MLDEERKNIINDALEKVLPTVESNLRKVDFIKKMIKLPHDRITSIQLEMTDKLIQKYIDEI